MDECLNIATELSVYNIHVHNYIWAWNKLDWIRPITAFWSYSPSSKNVPFFFTRPAKIGEDDVLYELILELAHYEGKDIATLPLTKENLRRFGFSENPHFCTEFAECEDKVVGYALYYYAFSANQGYPYSLSRRLVCKARI